MTYRWYNSKVLVEEEGENNNVDFDALEDQEVDFKVSSVKKAFQLSSPSPSSSSSIMDQNVYSTESKVEESNLDNNILVDDNIKFKPNNNFKLPPINSGNY